MNSPGSRTHSSGPETAGVVVDALDIPIGPDPGVTSSVADPTAGAAATRGTAPAPGQVWAIRAESLHLKNAETFHVITCLWNVLGHIFPAAARLEVLRQCARLVAPQGRIFIDVNHRYNARHYGFAATALRMLRDRLSPGENNGDVKVTWPLAGAHCSTAGHVFTHTEFASLCRAAGLIIERRVVVDYASGKQRHRSLGGHLLYELRPA